MIIFDETTDKSLTNITLLLSKPEATQMLGYLEELLLHENTRQGQHFHLNNNDFSKELTISLYNSKQCSNSFADKYKALISLEGS